MISNYFSGQRIKGIILILVAVFFLAGATSTETSKERVRVLISYDIDSLRRTQKKGEGGGLFIGLLSHIASQEQWDIDYIYASDKCPDKLNPADFDLIVATAYSTEKAREYDFNREAVISTWGQVYTHKKTDIESLLDLSGLAVGVVKDSTYNQGLRKTLKHFNVQCKFVEFNHSGEVFRAIKKRWIDVGLADRLYGMKYLDKYSIKRTRVILLPRKLHFAVPKGRKQKLIDAIDYHLIKLKEDPDSIYYSLINQIFGVSGNSKVSRWLIWGIGIALALSFIAGGTSLVLRQQIRIKTTQLSKKNEKLDEEIMMREKVKEALAQSEERYRSLIENTLDGYFVFKYSSGKIMFLNQRICELFGYTKESAYQKFPWEFLSRKDQDMLKKNIQSQVNGKLPDRAHGTYTAVRKDGSTFYAEISASPVNYQGKIVIQGILRDITEQESMKQHLQHAEKMEAVGTLAGGIAHDYNNLLMCILGNASLMRMDLDSGHPHYDKLKHIEEYVQSGSALTKQLLGFARGGKYEVRSLDLNEVVEKTSHMFGRTRKEVKIHASYERNVWPVEADQGQIEQVLLNLYLNAGQAMPTGGNLYLKTENVTMDEDNIQAHRIKQGKYVKMSVVDNGVGMDEETLNRIFEPFFTTREMGRGTGLGLASAYGIIKNHDGFIYAYSEKGKGTTFSIYLPIAKTEAMIYDENAHEKMEIQTGEGTVLLVDDEEIVADVGTSILEKIGYYVLVAKSGEEALVVYKEKGELIDMVILDMIMPGMGGGETFEGLKQIDPSVKVLLSSGYSVNSQATEILKRGCRGFIQKPFTIAELSKKLREVIIAS
ncbi:MAG: PAS domain S-box protein [Thermodesulfobacteriota bacterium]|nr:PAS domain S-box protein [Thermodesulfobacteriota bacterium]